MKDIVPELLEKIQASFDKKISEDKAIAEFMEKVKIGTATMEELSLYGRKLGDHLADTLAEYVTPDVLPDEKMYFNIADRIISATMHNNYNLANAAAMAVQKSIDLEAGIGLNAVKAAYPEERVMSVINGLTDETTTWETIQHRMNEPVRNISQSFIDDFMLANAEFRSKAGLKTRIVRTPFGKCCDWCRELAGSYAYPDDTPKDVFRRHDNCRCTVVYKSEKGEQNVWTKKWNEQGESDKIEVRKKIGLNNLGMFKPKEYSHIISDHVKINRSVITNTAKDGGRHKGTYNDAIKKSLNQLKRSIISHAEQVERHAEKIAHPEKYITDWATKDEAYQKGLIRKWNKDIQRNAEQAEIELAVFEERFKDE